MTGEYQESDQILVTLTVGNEEGDEQEVDAVVDTGFGGYLMLTPEVVEALALPQTDVGTAVLAAGSIVRLAVHEVIVIWNEEERAVSAYVGEGDILIGMALLRGSVGAFDFSPGCLSTIEPRE